MADNFKSDFRGHSQEAKRAASHKAKWAYGVDTAPDQFHSPSGVGRDAAHPRPVRCSDFTAPRHTRDRFHAMKKADNAKRDHASQPIHNIVRKLPNLNSDESASSADEDHEMPILGDSEILSVGGIPSSGSQVLSSALAKAIEAFEDKETVKLVKTEWSVLDDDGEEVGFSPVRKGRTKKDTPMIEDDDDYELI